MKIVFVIIALIIFLPLAIGLFLPREQVFVKTAQFKNSPKEIWEVITNVKDQAEWRDDVKCIEMINSVKGSEKWTEIPKKGRPITFKVKTYEAPSRYDIMIVNSSISGYWEGRIVEVGLGTKVEFKEILQVRNPYARILTYVFVDLNEIMELYMTNLKNKLEQQNETL